MLQNFVHIRQFKSFLFVLMWIYRDLNKKETIQILRDNVGNMFMFMGNKSSAAYDEPSVGFTSS